MLYANEVIYEEAFRWVMIIVVSIYAVLVLLIFIYSAIAIRLRSSNGADSNKFYNAYYIMHYSVI